jgi:hypothetical protein
MNRTQAPAVMDGNALPKAVGWTIMAHRSILSASRYRRTLKAGCRLEALTVAWNRKGRQETNAGTIQP